LKLSTLFSDLEKANEMWDWYTKRENSMVKDLFVGQLKSSLHCTHCEKTSVMYDPFWDLSVPVPSTPNCKLDKCLELFTVKDVLDGNEMPYCDVSDLEKVMSDEMTGNLFSFSIVKPLENALKGSQFNVSQNI
jgi:ubiquitin C-terminal hydrolase